MSEKTEKSNILSSPLLPLGIAGATYLAMRAPRYAKGLLGDYQRASKGKLYFADNDKYIGHADSYLSVDQPDKSLLKNVTHNILRSFGDITPTTSKELKKTPVKDGVVFFTGTSDIGSVKGLHNISKTQVPHGVNAPGEHTKLWNDKLHEYHKAKDVLPKGSYPEVHVYSRSPKNPGESVKSYIERQNAKHQKSMGDFVIKPRYGRGGGAGEEGLLSVYRFPNDKKYFSKTPVKDQNKLISQNPQEMIVQKYVDAPRYPSYHTGYIGEEREFRADIVGGKVLNVRPRSWPQLNEWFKKPGHRLSATLEAVHQELDIAGKYKARRFAKDVAQRLAKDSPMESHGLDIMIDRAGNPKIIELNPGGASGFMGYGRTPHKLYKTLTGRYTKVDSGAAAVTTGAATHYLQKKVDQKNG